MWQLLATLGCLVVLTNAQSSLPFQPLSDELVNYVNKRNTTWKVSCGDFCACPFLGIGLCVLTPKGGG